MHLMFKGIQYIPTYHLQERMIERLNLNINQIDICAYLYDLVKSSKENKRIFNDTAYISYLYDKYGANERFKFLECDKCIFICKEKEPNKFVIVTCFTYNALTRKHFLQKPRY